MTRKRIENLDRLLARRARPSRADEAAAARLLARLDSLPRQRRALFGWPGVLLEFDFAPAWPRVAVLACAAALGCAVGLFGLDPRFTEGTVASAQVADAGLSAVSEPELFTGVRP
jgi:hypothetical protein